MLRSLLATLVVLSAAHARTMGIMDLQSLVDRLGDEILAHPGLNPAASASVAASSLGAAGVHDLGRAVGADEAEDRNDDGFEDADEDDVPHPVKINNWGADLDVGQVAGIAVNPDDEPVIFHRGPVVWDKSSFDRKFQLVSRTPIANDTLTTLDPDTGAIKHSWGGNLFYMPHGLAIDMAGNTYVTDVGLHQVMRFAPDSETPDLVLGEAFTPGSDNKHFCQPTAVAVSERNGFFFVADGYCNSRIMKFNKEGKLIKIIKGNWRVPHSLALFEDEDVLCVSDRDGGKIDCVRAGLQMPKQGDRDETGMEVISYTGIGRSYAIAPKGTALLSVNGSPNVRGLTIDTAAHTPKILDQWGASDLTAPHAMSISLTGDAVFVAEIDPKKKNNVHKFEVVRSPTFF
jgi:peptidylamidoglycolate lyase